MRVSFYLLFFQTHFLLAENEASIFSRILLRLPLVYKVADKKDLAPPSDMDSEVIFGKDANSEKEAKYVSI